MIKCRVVASLLLVAIVGAGCSSPAEPDDPGTGTGTRVTATMNGAAWRDTTGFPFARQLAGPVLSMSFREDVSPFRTLTFLFQSVTSAGTYTYSGATATTRYATVSQFGGQWSTVHADGVGTITFTTLTSTHAVGTFSFTAGPLPGTSGNLVVTNGIFDIPVTP